MLRAPQIAGAGSPYVIVIGNEKGGSGKTTLAMHLAVALLKEGQRVGTIDLDSNQRGLTRYIENRRIWANHRRIELELPLHHLVLRAEGGKLRDNEAEELAGRVTVPVLWDRRRETIVNNESGEIIRMFDAWPGARGPLFRPPELASNIDALNAEIYRAVNNGVYRAGFATTQAAYEEAYQELFAMLDRIEHRLSERTFLLGEQITEADWRL